LGLGEAAAFNGFVGHAFGFIELFLLARSIYVIRTGRLLRKKYPPGSASGQPRILKPFLLVVLIEAPALSLVSILAHRLHRPDLAPDWYGTVVGLHFLPLAKIFGAPGLAVIGILIALWCLLCWALFRPETLTIAVSIGTGILLWAASASALFRARKIVNSLR
jgi:hypothetical protein